MAVIDLTQLLGPATTPWPGTPHLRAEVTAGYEADGLFARELAMPEHLGTHLDAPRHFRADGAAVADLPAELLVREAVVLDLRDECADDPGFVVTAAHVERAEAAHGALPAGALVLACTGWDRHVGDPARYLGDPLAFPGYGDDAAAALIDRGVAGIGIDTLGVDPGASTAYPVHHRTSAAGVYHLEGLVRLGELPPRGATVVVGVPPLAGGSGMTARVLALV